VSPGSIRSTITAALHQLNGTAAVLVVDHDWSGGKGKGPRRALSPDIGKSDGGSTGTRFPFRRTSYASVSIEHSLIMNIIGRCGPIAALSENNIPAGKSQHHSKKPGFLHRNFRLASASNSQLRHLGAPRLKNVSACV
jgi:hypothetical protein